MRQEMLEDSAVVVAHPDDEALWFSSILGQVGRIVLCYLDVASHPEWGAGRRAAIAQYPLRGVVSLGIRESEAFDRSNWHMPVRTTYGLAITHDQQADMRYRANYLELERRLGDVLAGRRNVFAHNPWGEYGHEEHVQLHRAVEALQRRLGFNLWYSNYCSNKSLHLMRQHEGEFAGDFVTLPTNPALGAQLRDLYLRNNCWTWYGDHEWPQSESFLCRPVSGPAGAHFGRIFPLNFVRVDYAPPLKPRYPEWLRRPVGVLRRLKQRIRTGLLGRDGQAN
jgi:LmbE family N-acetylglucosaminyl deacetylase